MPATLPYDHPSLILGSVVNPSLLGLLNGISQQQQKISSAQQKLNSFMMMKRSLSMTITELLDLNIEIDTVRQKIQNLDTSIAEAAGEYVLVKLDAEESIQKLRVQIAELPVDDQLESPVDFSASTLINRPLSTDSLNLDAQYFSYESDSGDDVLSNIESYIKENSTETGQHAGTLAKKASGALAQQTKNHQLSGTLIIMANCTHSNVSLFDPLTLDAEKAITLWNNQFGPKDIDVSQLTSVIVSTDTSQEDPDRSLSLLSGFSKGSSFIGMVHLVKSEMNGPPDIDMQQLQEKLRLGGWLENVIGGFGVDQDVLKEVKRLLNIQQISAHVSLITLGVIPSIASNKMQVGLAAINQPEQQALNEILKADNDSSLNTVGSMAATSKKQNQLLKVQQAKIKTYTTELNSADMRTNQILDVNSLMTAFENYLSKIEDKNSFCGAPVQFFIKKITKDQIINAWKKGYIRSKLTPIL